MKIKRVLCPQRLRELPSHWGWVDHRLVREEYVGRCDTAALALYLFLACVADAQGLSYYSDPSICRRLRLEMRALESARAQLLEVGLLAYEKPFYQVLSLEARPQPSLTPTRPRGNGEARPIGDVVVRMLGGVS